MNSVITWLKYLQKQVTPPSSKYETIYFLKITTECLVFFRDSGYTRPKQHLLYTQHRHKIP